MATHLYAVGQNVYFTSAVDRPGSEGTYKIVSYLPLEGDEHRYRIKRDDDPFERVARESQLDRTLDA